MTTPPSISEIFSDSLEFQLVVPSFGIAHPTGYPLYTLLGGLWSRVLFPIGNWAWRMNLFSALTGATAVALLALLGQRLAPANSKFRIPWAALIFALIPVWWQQATIAEVYTLHLCLVGAILIFAIPNQGDKVTRWQGEIAQPDSGLRTQDFSPRHASFTPIFFLIGLSLAHHRTTLLLLPGLAIYWLVTQPAIFRPQRVWLKWAAALLSPLLLYLYLPIRTAQGVRDLHGDYVNSWTGFLRHVLASGYTNFFADNPLAQTRNLWDWLALFQQQMGTWQWMAALIGILVILWRSFSRRENPGWLLIALVLVANLIFAVNYKVADVEVFLLPVFFCVALFCEAGINWLLSLLGNDWRLCTVASMALIGVILFTADWQSMLNRASDWSIHNYAVTMAKTPFPPNSRVIGLEGEMSLLRYMQQAESLGLNAQPIVADSSEARKAAVAESVADGHPTYLTREVPGIEALYDFSGEGVLVRVWQKETVQLPSLPQPLDINLLDGKLKLSGYDLQKLDQPGDIAWQLALDWQVQQPIQQSLKYSLRWLDAAGSTLSLPDGAQGQDEFPLRQVSPTNYWQAGKTMRDVQIIRLPTALQAVATTLQMIIYDSATGNETGRWQVDLPR